MKRVLFVGGVERLERELHKMAGELGVEVETHTGSGQGHRAARLGSLVRRSDVVVVCTSVVSHNGVHTVKREAQGLGVRLVMVRSLGASVARELLASVAAGAGPGQHAA